MSALKESRPIEGIVFLRMRWAPVFVLNSDIYTALRPFAEVTAMKHDMYVDARLEGVATGVRTVVLYGDKHQVPHIIQVVDPDTAAVWNCLVTIPGHPPMCLRCKVVGHVRKNCNTPYCRHHRQYGHATEGCRAVKAIKKSRKSYARYTDRYGGVRGDRR